MTLPVFNQIHHTGETNVGMDGDVVSLKGLVVVVNVQTTHQIVSVAVFHVRYALGVNNLIHTTLPLYTVQVVMT